jgi:hypothetical protein
MVVTIRLLLRVHYPVIPRSVHFHFARIIISEISFFIWLPGFSLLCERLPSSHLNRHRIFSSTVLSHLILYLLYLHPSLLRLGTAGVLDTLWIKSYRVHLMCSFICSLSVRLYWHLQSKKPAGGNLIHFHCSYQTVLDFCWGLASGVDTLVPAHGAVSSGGHFQTCWASRGWITFP